ncbi:cell division protein FtsX [Malaciobacter marinus]|uniref:Cell division protein FtsX n=1 Tax=Malaciobacter marinus TaxID=505249 RepID=A0A347TJU4_9BACT|nr:MULTISPECIES: cell division protein FtsX [Malaciobacter]AXX86872.1 cell division protein FtsX [Malaciobacter marinus]PHO13003.1 cell division protein FtsX [Malaciobacter marinus]PHO15829.1 cell division protein FtsX [Malaciobacter marinus]RYA23821.1 cell division protein FtsX [Malaciobacter halophilus]
MKFLKNILAFVIPLSAMLITFTLYLFAQNTVNQYKKKISNDYSIVVITNTPLIKENINKLSNINVNRIVTLKKEEIIDDIKSNLSDTSIKLLRQKLPNFYKIHLEEFPTTTELNNIKDELYKNKNIRKVEIFSKNHNQVFLLLLLINEISLVLFVVILIFSILILAKQIQIWFYEHQEKIAILQLHGASILYSSSTIIKYAILSAFIAFFLVAGLFTFLVNNLILIFPQELSEIVDVEISLSSELVKLFFLSLGISILTIFGVLIKYKIKND